jgi:hypothetical protein
VTDYRLLYPQMSRGLADQADCAQSREGQAKIKVQRLVTNFHALLAGKMGNRLQKGLRRRNMSAPDAIGITATWELGVEPGMR